MYEVETIQIDDDNRLVVYVDEFSDSPLDWGWDVEIHDIDNYNIWRGWGTPDDSVAYAAYNAQQKVRNREWTEEQRDRAIHIFKLWAGDTREFKIHDWTGYSKSDWATVLEIGEDIGLYASYAAWRRGDVFIVKHQKRLEYVRRNGDEFFYEDIHEEWEGVDSLAGCYLDDKYTALDVAREHFDVEIGD